MARPRARPCRERPRLAWGLLAALTALAPRAAAAAPPPESSSDLPGAPPLTSTPSAAGARATLRPTVFAPEAGASRPASADGVLAQRIDLALAEAAGDLGLSLVPPTGLAPEPTPPGELTREARRGGRLVIAPVLRRRGDALELEIVVARAEAKVLLTRVELVEPDDAVVRAVVMLRDLVREVDAARARRGSGTSVGEAPPPGPLVLPARSEGRLTLAVNATLYGGLVGYSIQRASGSDDPRLLYPLMAVGAGVGLGGSMIVAGEWDVGVGDAWYLAAGAWWPTFSGLFIYEGRFARFKPEEEADEKRWTYGLIGGTAGLTLSTLALTLGKMESGGALLAHSGGALGTVYGGLCEMAIDGSIDFLPEAGMGYGAAIGWLGASAVAVHVQPSPSRMLAMDLGFALGGLAGAALASPLLFDEPTENQQRAWLGATAGASVLGGGAALWWTASSRAPEGGQVQTQARAESVERAVPLGVVRAAPRLGALPDPAEVRPSPGGPPTPPARAPAYGAVLTGVWW